jgi:hypothetical protein
VILRVRRLDGITIFPETLYKRTKMTNDFDKMVKDVVDNYEWKFNKDTKESVLTLKENVVKLTNAVKKTKI